MKLSVSIPDGLWMAWKVKNPDISSPSELIQRAIRTKVTRQDLLDMGVEKLADILSQGWEAETEVEIEA
jgi:hypothetical protein